MKTKIFIDNENEKTPFKIELKNDNFSLDEVESFQKLLSQEIKDYKNRTKKFKINEYITLKLEENQTNIYIKGFKFLQCKFLFLNIPKNEIEQYDDIRSIDEASERLDSRLELGRDRKKFNITPEQEFQGHCSNLQVWYENHYDTRLLHRNIAFPLLKKLAEIGDPLAKRKYKDEIALRIDSGEANVLLYLINGHYLDPLEREELEVIYANIKTPIAKAIFGSYLGLENYRFSFSYQNGVFIANGGKIVLLNNSVLLKYNDYHKPQRIDEKIKCKLIANDKFIDFFIRTYEDKKVVFSMKYLRMIKKVFEYRGDIQIFLPKSYGPLKFYDPINNIYAIIEPIKLS